jgi:hypothetical protein
MLSRRPPAPGLQSVAFAPTAIAVIDLDRAIDWYRDAGESSVRARPGGFRCVGTFISTIRERYRDSVSTDTK